MSTSLAQLTEQFARLLGSAAPTGSPVVTGLAEVGPAVAKPMADKPASPPPAIPAPATAATPAAPTVVAPPPPNPIQSVDYALKGYHFDVTVASNQVVAAAEILNQAGFGMDTITGVDWIAQNEMEVVYDYFHPTSPLRVVVRTRIPRATPELPTIAGVFPGANWHERETHDFFGIRFAGHPNLTPFLLPEDADFHPLLKDYKP
jgi:NADH-quinone oxidoreductase subunit C